jgi:tetratricopeptide (TPR) repeat protein
LPIGIGHSGTYSGPVAGFLIIGVLGGLLTANGSDVISNAAPTTGVVAVAVAISETNAVVEKEYETLLAADDAAQSEVDKWIRDNNEFKAKGAGTPDAELNRRIRDRFEPVRKAYDDFVRRYPRHARARLAYVSFLGDLQDEAGAQAQWEKALELDPGNPSAYNNLAGAYSENGDKKKAFEYFSKAIELNPSEALYYHNFGNSIYVLRKAAMAYYVLQRPIIAQQGRESLLATAIGGDWKGKLSPLLYLAAVPLAFFSPWFANGLYVFVALLWLVPDRRIERMLEKQREMQNAE